MKITNLKKGMLASLQIRTDNNVLYIVNENPTDVLSLEPGFIVCGFGEGKFKHMAKTAGADDPQGKAVLFSMTSSEDFVILNGRWVKVGQVIRQHQNTQPSAKVAYHETRENVKAEDLTYLVFERVNDIYFIPGKTHVEAGELEKGHKIKAAEDAKTQNGCMSLLGLDYVDKRQSGLEHALDCEGTPACLPTHRPDSQRGFASWTGVQPLVLF